MTLVQAVIMGIIQGLTEFIPVSSTAHLVFASRILQLFAGDVSGAEKTTASIAVLQLGTLAAVLIYFAPDILRITYAFVVDHLALAQWFLTRSKTGADMPTLSQDCRLGWLVFIGSLPIGIVGLLLKKQIEGRFTKNLWLIATMMIVVALVLLIAELVSKHERGMEQLGLFDAIVVGCAQVLALIPGASRSGSTMMAGLFAGEKRETAARFSFLLSIPAVAASGLLELKQSVNLLPQGSLSTLAVGTLVAAVVGYASIFFLLRFLRHHSTGVFIGYRLIAGITILVLLFVGATRANVSASEHTRSTELGSQATR